jgi:hypothetical protein
VNRQQIAAHVAERLRLLADACDLLVSKTSTPEQKRTARDFLEAQRDNYWRGLVVGVGEIDDLLSEENDQ